MATIIKLKRDTSTNWSNANPILKDGEPGLETDTGKIKYGDGVTLWNNLNYGTSDSFQRMYRTPVYNPIISKQCQYYPDLENFIIDVRLTGDILGTTENPKYWAPISVHTDIKTIIFYETDEDGNYLNTFNAISVGLIGDGLCYTLNREVKDKNGLTGKISIVVDWTLWKHGTKEAMTTLRLNDDVLKDHFGFISILENVEITTDNIKPEYIKNADRANIIAWNSGVITEYHGESGFTFKSPTIGMDGGIVTEVFVPNPNYHCIVDVNIKSITPNATVTVYLFGATGDVYLTAKQVGIGNTKFEFDPAYYTVYHNQTSFYLILSTHAQTSTITVDVDNFVCAQYPIGQTGNLSETIKELQNKISVLEGEVVTLQSTPNIILTSPSGSKYSLGVTDDLNVIAVPVMPNKALFIGNSLLLGNGTFGMNASDKDKDYYTLVNEHVLAYGDGDYVPSKMSGTDLESCETTTAGNTWLDNVLKPQLSLDLDLVIVQLGENVDTEAKRKAFKDNAKIMIRTIRSIAKTARVAWVYGWYANDDVRRSIQDACKEYGGIYIEISDLATPENQSKIGTVVTKAATQQQTLTYTSYYELATNVLNIYFEINGQRYNSVIPVDSYSDDKTAKQLTWTGKSVITVNEGVASHPGDAGFDKIAQRIIERLNL